MFKWLGQRPEKRKQKTRQLWEREFNIVKEGLDEEQVVAFVDNLIAQHKASQRATSASVRSVLKTAVTDAEQMAASIKMKARAEAEAEVATIISQAKQEAQQEAQEIKRRAEIATQKEAEDILSVTHRKAEIIEVEVKQKVLLFLLRAREEIEKEIRGEYEGAYSRLSSSLQDLVSEGQNIEVELKSKRAGLWESKRFELKEDEAALLSSSGAVAASPETSAPVETQIEPDIASKEEKIEQPAQLQEEASEEKIEQPAQLQEEASEEKIEQPIQLQEEAPVSEPVGGATEELLGQHPQEERPGTGETKPAQLKQDSQTLYAGEVELVIAMPVELVTVSKLYNHLQTIPELRILRTAGSWDQGTTITVVLEKPIPLLSIISKIPSVEVTPELPHEDSLVKTTSSSPLGAKRRGVKRIKLTLKEAQPPVG